MTDVKEQVNNHIWEQTFKQISNQVLDMQLFWNKDSFKIKDQIWNQVWFNVWDQVLDDLK